MFFTTYLFLWHDSFQLLGTQEVPAILAYFLVRTKVGMWANEPRHVTQVFFFCTVEASNRASTVLYLVKMPHNGHLTEMLLGGCKRLLR